MSKKERLIKLFKEIEALEEDKLYEIEVAVKSCKVVQALRKADRINFESATSVKRLISSKFCEI